MSRLNIPDRRERALVTAADALLRPAGLLRRATARGAPTSPARILVLRLERIGDLLMALPALAQLRALAGNARIDLAVGSWNREIAGAIASVDGVQTLDAPWLSRESGGGSFAALLAKSRRRWRTGAYDLAINLEPDIRSNLLLAASAAPRLAGFTGGGGGPLLDVAVQYDTTRHASDNAVSLVLAAMHAAAPVAADPALKIPEAARSEAARLLGPRSGRLLAGIHPSGGRAIKQWPEARFHDVAERLIADRDALVVLTGAPADRAMVDLIRAGLPESRVLDLCGRAGLLTLAAVIERLDLFVSGDTGPLHLARAVGTPIVAVFGPSDPARYGPRGANDRVVRIDLPCSPCNRIRLPPARCVGHTPDCLAGIDTARVLAAIDEVLRDTTGVRRTAGASAGATAKATG